MVLTAFAFGGVSASPQSSHFATWGSQPGSAASSAMRCMPSTSWKRAGALGTSAPRPMKAPNSATVCQPADTASAFEDLMRRTRGVSLSSQRLRSLPSSPDPAAPAPRCTTPMSPASSLVVGFDLRPTALAGRTACPAGGAGRGGISAAWGTTVAPAAATSATGQQSAAQVQAPAAGRPAKAKGLLSQALDVTPTVTEIGRASSLPEDPALFFPDVDLRPLKEAQVKHAVFRSEMVSTAYMIAARCYTGQVRKNGASLLSHCLETSILVADLGLDADTVAAALLHEALRDGDRFLPQLEEFMPRSVVTLVERVQVITEVSHLYRSYSDQLGDEGLRRMLIAMEDVGAVLIKLADRVHNMRTVAALPHDRQVALARETLEVYSVVANRLGVWFLKAELEDSAFAVLHPTEHAQLKEQVRERHDPVALEETINTIRTNLDAQGIQYEDISGRQKNLYGIWTKMQRDGKTLDQVLDVVALRVVVANKHDCYLAMRSVHGAYRTVPQRHKDYISGERKANGYQSLHDTVVGAGGRPVEVQVRTHKMHYIAEFGFAAHWKYKEKLDSEDKWLDKQVQYAKWLTNCKLGMHDKKVRPMGSPPTDGALKGLGLQYVNASRPEEMTKVDPFLKHERFRMEPPSPAASSVLVQTHTSSGKLHHQEHTFLADMPVAALSRQLGVHETPGYVLLLNGRLPASGAVLRSSDLVQVVPESEAYGRSPPRAVPVAPPTPPARTLAPMVPVWEELDMFVPGRAQPVVVGMPARGANLLSGGGLEGFPAPALPLLTAF